MSTVNRYHNIQHRAILSESVREDGETGQVQAHSRARYQRPACQNVVMVQEYSMEAPAQMATGTTAWARGAPLHLSLVLVAHSPLVNLLQSCCTSRIAGKGITTATMIFCLVSRSYAEKRVLIRKCLALSQSRAFVKKSPTQTQTCHAEQRQTRSF